MLVCVSACVCVCVLTIVSMDKILHFTNTLIIIIRTAAGWLLHRAVNPGEHGIGVLDATC